MRRTEIGRKVLNRIPSRSRQRTYPEMCQLTQCRHKWKGHRSKGNHRSTQAEEKEAYTAKKLTLISRILKQVLMRNES